MFNFGRWLQIKVTGVAGGSMPMQDMAALESAGLYVAHLDSRSSRPDSSSLFRSSAGSLVVEAAPTDIPMAKDGRWYVAGRWQMV